MQTTSILASISVWRSHAVSEQASTEAPHHQSTRPEERDRCLRLAGGTNLACEPPKVVAAASSGVCQMRRQLAGRDRVQRLNGEPQRFSGFFTKERARLGAQAGLELRGR